jgi:hypothetical protein
MDAHATAGVLEGVLGKRVSLPDSWLTDAAVGRGMFQDSLDRDGSDTQGALFPWLKRYRGGSSAAFRS